MPIAIQGEPYPLSLGTAPGLTWSVVSGSLPGGLTLQPDGSFTGLPTPESGSFNVVFRATGSFGSSDFSRTIQANARPVWRTSESIITMRGSALQPIFATDAQTISYSVISGSLPPNLIGTTTTIFIPPFGNVRAYTFSGLVSNLLAPGSVARITLRATDNGPGALSSDRTFEIRVTDAPVVGDPPMAVVGSPYSFNLGNSTTDPVVWSVAPGSMAQLPDGLTLSPEGLISGVPLPQPNRRHDSSSSDITFRATLVADPSQTADYVRRLPVNTPPVWLTPAGRVATVARGGALPNLRLAAADPHDASSGSPTYTIVDGALPPGLSLSSQSNLTVGDFAAGPLPSGLSSSSRLRAAEFNGSVSNAAIPGATYTFTLRATDYGLNGNQQYSLSADRTFEIRVADLQIANTLPPAYRGMNYTAQAVVLGVDTASLSASGLPVDLSLDENGIISGVVSPSVSLGNMTVSFSATIDGVQSTWTRTLRIVESAIVWGHNGNPVPTTTFVRPASNSAMTPISIPFTAPTSSTGCAVVSEPSFGWGNLSTNVSGTVPNKFCNITGTLGTGTPIDYRFTLSFTGSNVPPDTQQIRVIIEAANGAMRAIPAPEAALGEPYSHALGQNATATLVWSLQSGTLPPGLNLTPDGLLSGTPTTAGTFNATVRSIAPGGGTFDTALSIIVRQRPVFTTPAGALGIAYANGNMSVGISATGPDGIVCEIVTPGMPFSISPSTGVISGATPTASFSGHRYVFTVRARAAAGSTIFSDREFIIDTAPQPSGVWGANSANALVLPNGVLHTVLLGGSGSWRYLNGSDYACPNPAFVQAGYSFTPSGVMSFTPINGNLNSSWSNCTLRITNGLIQTDYNNRYIASVPKVSLDGPEDLGVIYSGHNGSFLVSIPATNAHSVTVVSGTLSSGTNISVLNSTTIHIIGTPTPVSTEHIHQFRLRLSGGQITGGAATDSVERTFTLRVAPAPPGIALFEHRSGNFAYTATIGVPHTITLGGQGTWNYADGSGGQCLHPANMAPGWSLSPAGIMSFTPVAVGGPGNLTSCNLSLTNGSAVTSWNNRFILPNPPPSFTGPDDLGTVFGGATDTFISIPVTNASTASIVSGVPPSGMSLSRINNSELRLIGPVSPITLDQIHVFTIRIESQNGNTSSVRPEPLERTFTLRARPQPSGLWATGASNQLLVSPGIPFEHQLEPVGTWTWTASGGGACPTPGLVLHPDGRLEGTPVGTWTATCNLHVQNGEASSFYNNRSVRSQ